MEVLTMDPDKILLADPGSKPKEIPVLHTRKLRIGTTLIIDMKPWRIPPRVHIKAGILKKTPTEEATSEQIADGFSMSGIIISIRTGDGLIRMDEQTFMDLEKNIIHKPVGYADDGISLGPDRGNIYPGLTFAIRFKDTRIQHNSKKSAAS